MKWASVLKSTEGTPKSPAAADLNCEDAVAELHASLLEELGSEPDLLILFVSPDHKKNFEKIVNRLRSGLPGESALIGCTAGGLIAGGREVEQQSALALVGAVLPGVKIQTFHVAIDQLPDLDDPPQSWEKLLNVENSQAPSFILLTDPFGFKVDSFVQGLDYAFAKSVKIGGLASGGHKAGENRLVCQDQIYRSGLVGVALSGNIQVDSVVAQGCRAIGKPSRVTKCDRNLLYELDGKPAVLVLKESIERLPERDQKLAKEAIFLGVLVGEYRILKCISPAIPNAMAAILLHIRDMTSCLPHIYMGWTEGNPVLYVIKFIFLGEGETAPVTREILREVEKRS